MVCEVGRAVGAEGLVAGQIVDIKSEGMAEQVRAMLLLSAAQVLFLPHTRSTEHQCAECTYLSW